MVKKILFIITQSEFGGAQRFLANFTTSLDKNKYEILVAAGPEGDDKNGVLSFLEKKGISTRHLKSLKRSVNPLLDLLGLFEIRKLIKKEKPDTMFLCSSKAGFLGSLAAKGMNIKVIYRIGGWTFNDPRCRLSKGMYKQIEKISAKWKQYIIVNSEYERKQAIKLGIKPKQKIVTVYNGVDLNKLDFLLPEQAREKVLGEIERKEKDKDCLLGTIANLYPSKGLEYLITSANALIKKNPRIVFVVIGEGEEREKLEKLIEKYDLKNNFFLIGAIPEAYKYLKAFDIFVLSSVKEGLPWTILEAMAAETPIVATKVAGIPEVLEDKSSGLLVESKNPKQLAKAIKRLLDNKELKKKLANQARKRVEEKLGLQKMVDNIEKLFSV